MKRIIKHGKNYAEATYLRKCRVCGCQFEYGRNDLQETYYDQRDGLEFWYVACPECGDSTGFAKPEPINL